MTTTNSPRIYPGLVCGAIEFFLENNTLKVMSRGKVKDFKDAPFAYHQLLKEHLEKDPEADEILRKWYPKSELKRMVQFGSCRFGGLDFFPDVTQSKMQCGEFIPCAIRHKCPGAGIICKAPKYKGVDISFEEVEILQALATIDTNENIAFKIKKPLGTFHLIKKVLYRKLGIQTKQEAAMVCRDLNLI